MEWPGFEPRTRASEEDVLSTQPRPTWPWWHTKMVFNYHDIWQILWLSLWPLKSKGAWTLGSKFSAGLNKTEMKLTLVKWTIIYWVLWLTCSWIHGWIKFWKENLPHLHSTYNCVMERSKSKKGVSSMLLSRYEYKKRSKRYHGIKFGLDHS